jgi:hypothetical protein
MQSRAVRIVLGVACLAALAAAAFFIVRSEKTIASRNAALSAFDVRAREAIDAFGDLRVAQQAYVAAGQGIGFWMPKVDQTTTIAGAAIDALQEAKRSDASKAPLDEAAAALVEFGKVDKRIRDYLKAGSQLMAADVVFTEGVETAANAARLVDRARTEEHLAADRFEASQRKAEAMAGTAAASVVALIVLGLSLTTGRTASAPARDTGSATSLRLQSAGEQTSTASADSGSAGHDLPLRADAAAKGPELARAAETQKQTASAAAWRTAAQVCTDLGRVTDPGDLKGLMAKAADALGASGLMLWVGTATGSELRAVLAHGYSADMVARIPAVPRSANNAAATAYRTGTLQIILSRPGGTTGAVVAPVLSADGCIGVLSAEIRDGGEASDTVQALAAIFAAQLAGVIETTPATTHERDTAAM